MRELGIGAFRLSIAWPRILPEGRGRVNQAGLDFYDRLVDELLANDLDPYVTLYHWDLPQVLEDRGGWPVRDTVGAFTEYAEVVAARLGDRVRHWITQNEPWVVSWLGYGLGVHAPGRESDRDALAAGHHVLLAHGRAAKVLRREAPAAEVGISIDLVPDVSLLGCRRPTSRPRASPMASATVGSWIRFWVTATQRTCSSGTPRSSRRSLTGTSETIAAPLDFLGINYYTRNVVRAGGSAQVATEGASERTDMGWEVYPDGLRELLVRLHAEYELPDLYITENGAAFPDARNNGSVPDPRRISYLEGHLAALARPSPTASRCGATSSGRCSTTSSGRSASPGASGSSTSTSRRSNACRRTASRGTATSSRPNAPNSRSDGPR